MLLTQYGTHTLNSSPPEILAPMLSYPVICLIHILKSKTYYDLLPNSENEGVENRNPRVYHYFTTRFLHFFPDVLSVHTQYLLLRRNVTRVEVSPGQNCT